MSLGSSGDYVRSWERRVISNALKNETAEDVLNLIRRELFLNRGRCAALVVRMGEARRKELA